MKRPLVLLLLIFAPQEVGAAPVQCPGPPEIVSLRPVAVFVDGGEVFRTTTGRYRSDAGLEFDVEAVQLDPLHGMAVNGCLQPSTTTRVELIDPFTGASHSLTMEVTP